jgi:PKD repeat protein
VSDSGEKKFENAIEFSNSGIYIVTVTDTVLGSLRADTQEIEVVLPSNNNTGGGGDSEAVTPEANFVADVRNGYPDLEVTFTDLSEGSPREWLWDFGDGNTSTEEDPRHIYSEPGSYNVTLQVTYANGSDIEIRNRYIEVYDAASCEPGELDADNDGLINSVEAEIGTACDDADSDDDRLDDKLERELGTNPLNSDSDNDGLEDGEEQIQDTDPLNEDTDGDGILDGEEILGCRFERRDNQIVPNTCEPGTVDTTDPLTFNDLESLSVDTSGNAQEDSTNDNLLRILAIIIILTIISRLIYLKYKSMNHERKSY